MKEKKNLEIKLSLSLIYFIIIGILLVTAISIYRKDKKIYSFADAKETTDYCKITISKMSDKIAFYKNKDIGIHYVIEYENTGKWHTYLIAIDEKDIKKYEDIISFTYGKTKSIPKTIDVYGYPVLINKDLKKIAINHINDFVPKSNEIKITEENFDEYLTNAYMDTTKERTNHFNILLFLTLLALLFMILLLIYTLNSNSKIVKSIDKRKKSIKKLTLKMR